MRIFWGTRAALRGLPLVDVNYSGPKAHFEHFIRVVQQPLAHLIAERRAAVVAEKLNLVGSRNGKHGLRLDAIDLHLKLFRLVARIA